MQTESLVILRLLFCFQCCVYSPCLAGATGEKFTWNLLLINLENACHLHYWKTIQHHWDSVGIGRDFSKCEFHEIWRSSICDENSLSELRCATEIYTRFQRRSIKKHFPILITCWNTILDILTWDMPGGIQYSAKCFPLSGLSQLWWDKWCQWWAF